MKLSLIIPAHNEEKYLDHTLRAIKSQRKLLHEIIVVCDACTDNTPMIAKRHNTRIIRVNAKNISTARNRGAKEATGDAFIFLDADTIVDKHFVAETRKAITLGYTYGAYRYKGETKTGHVIMSIVNAFNRIVKTFSGICFVTRAAFEKSGGYDQRLRKSEDTELGERLRKRGEKFIFLQTPVTPSERKFKENGYISYLVSASKESCVYFFSKKEHARRYS